MKKRIISAIVLTMLVTFTILGCSQTQSENQSTSDTLSSVSAINTEELFTDRDLEQTADLTDAVSIPLKSGEDVTIDKEGVYVLRGEVKNVTVTIAAADEAKVQLVLDGVSITNEDAPAIYVKTGDKVYVTTTGSDNAVEVTGTYQADGDTNLDAAIFTKSDIVFNGTGVLKIISAEGNGVSSKNDLKITGGTYTITASGDGLEANDAIAIYEGMITIDTHKDALHSENEDDATLGYVYIKNGTLNLTAADDAIRATTILQIDGGTIDVKSCREGLEATSVQINGGAISINASDDGINATNKSTNDVLIEVNGGTITVVMGSGDTDAFDSNGDIAVNDGTINITANSAFDSNGTSELNGGKVTVNGEVITEITQQQMGGGGGGGRR
ncbi:MAG: carbohydrate-binding domain-containing protein [Eubacteriaceae bacterium]|nr:carbohydrate-binding domain-containing protein [Eubacteriaceae bacterium]